MRVKRMKERVSQNRIGESGAISGSPPPRQERLLSLDVFRGITLVGMVFVNNQGSEEFTYPIFAHASWHGWTIADLIFPFFLFIVGTAIPFSLDNQLASGVGGKAIFRKIVRRSVLLFAIGLFMNGFPYFDLSTIRISGVLQRIAVCYFCTALIYLKSTPKAQAVLAAFLLLFYYVVMRFVPVPGIGAGILEPNRNWAHYLDAGLLRGHMQFSTWEGKGVLSTLPAIATTLMGVLAGWRLKSAATPVQKAVDLYFFGVLSFLVGAVWSLTFPINQNLWTSSMVLFMGGMSLMLLASCYYVVDIRKIRWWTAPFVVLGMNSIAMWLGTKIFAQTLELIHFTGSDGATISVKAYLYGTLAAWTGPWTGCWLYALASVLFWLGIMGLMYRGKVFFKV